MEPNPLKRLLLDEPGHSSGISPLKRLLLDEAVPYTEPYQDEWEFFNIIIKYEYFKRNTIMNAGQNIVTYLESDKLTNQMKMNGRIWMEMCTGRWHCGVYRHYVKHIKHNNYYPYNEIRDWIPNMIVLEVARLYEEPEQGFIDKENSHLLKVVREDREGIHKMLTIQKLDHEAICKATREMVKIVMIAEHDKIIMKWEAVKLDFRIGDGTGKMEYWRTEDDTKCLHWCGETVRLLDCPHEALAIGDFFYLATRVSPAIPSLSFLIQPGKPYNPNLSSTIFEAFSNDRRFHHYILPVISFECNIVISDLSPGFRPVKNGIDAIWRFLNPRYLKRLLVSVWNNGILGGIRQDLPTFNFYHAISENVFQTEQWMALKRISMPYELIRERFYNFTHIEMFLGKFSIQDFVEWQQKFMKYTFPGRCRYINETPFNRTLFEDHARQRLTVYPTNLPGDLQFIDVWIFGIKTFKIVYKDVDGRVMDVISEFLPADRLFQLNH